MSEDDQTLAPAPAEPARTGPYQPAEAASELARVLDQYLADLQAGNAPDRVRFLAAHPDLAAQLEPCLAGIEFIHQAHQPAAAQPVQLGEFRLLREIGRGGMGVVYEAEQLSLKRKVALKVLRFGAAANESALQRFTREAETVARLHHTNIVPIFAVGCEQGVHYYAMQLIDGRSLADVLEERRRGQELPGPAEVARWGLQAAEALAHAHRRGVIHRDVKPSNLLLDTEGVLWLTDFGLARRADELALTLSGLILGTPRYMSPEQAAAAKQPVDHRSDLYSLGATLYELATGRPVFDAESPQALLSQIMHADPVAPRRLRPRLPRDLETIILKCLAKEPGWRFATARALANDLRAFLDGRPIQARQPSLVERSARWVRKQHKTGLVAAVGGVVAAILLLGGWLAARAHRDAQLGWLTLVSSDGTPLLAEVFEAEGDEPARERFTLPTMQPVALPAGWYRLRLTFPGRLSETYQVLIEQGWRRRLIVGANDRQLWDPLAISNRGDDKHHRGTAIVELDRRTKRPRPDLIVRNTIGPLSANTQAELIRIDGCTGKPLWQQRLEGESPPASVRVSPDAWRYIVATLDPNSSAWVSYENLRGNKPSGLVSPAPDLDGDGVGDLVWAGNAHLYTDAHSVKVFSFLLAVSGKGGKVLWCFSKNGWNIVCPPLVADVQGDGRPDLIVTFERRVSPGPGYPSLVQARVEAISGRTGQSLWHYDFPEQTNSIQFRRQVRAAQTVAAPTLGVAQSLPFVFLPVEGGSRLEDGSMVRYAARVNRVGNEPVVVAGVYQSIAGLDLRNGRPVWGPRQIDPPLLDLSRDGSFAVLGQANYNSRDSLHFAVQASSTGKVLWDRRPHGFSNTRVAIGDRFEPPSLIADLDGDGKPEIVSLTQILDGATGKPRWPDSAVRSISPEASRMADQHQSLGLGNRPVRLLGADFDGDGYPDFFAAQCLEGKTLGQSQARGYLRLEVRSGADGHLLARDQFQFGGLLPAFAAASDDDFPNLASAWLPAGSDGLPRFVVSNGKINDSERGEDLPASLPRETAIFSGEGKLEHLWPRVIELKLADLNGDGLPDLVGLLEEKSGVKIVAARGSPPEIWRRPGFWTPAILSEGPGFPDRYRQTVTYVAPPMPYGDLDGDGVPDVLVFRPDRSWNNSSDQGVDTGVTLQAFSGKTGRRLWQIDKRTLSPQDSGQVIPECFLLRCHDLDGDGRPEVIFGYLLRGGRDDAFGLAVIDGRTGKVRWKTKEAEETRKWPEKPCRFTDVNGDGVLDLVFGGPGPEMACYDGRTGEILNLSAQGIKRAGTTPPSGAEGFRYLGAWSSGEKTKEPSWWEFRLQNAKVTLRDILPATTDHAAVDIVESDGHTLFGLDRRTHKPLWRCTGPGEPGFVLPRQGPGNLPHVLFYLGAPEITVCLQALPAEPDGSYQPWSKWPKAQKPLPSDSRWVIPLPWDYEARQRLTQAIWPSLICLIFLIGFGLARRWWIVAPWVACLIVVPLAVGYHSLEPGNSFKIFEDERYAGGWYLLWPYSLTAWNGWSLLGNALVWMAAWLALVGGWSLVRKLAAARRQRAWQINPKR